MITKTFAKFDLPFRVYEGIQGSFNELPEDTSATANLGRPFRYRRWSEYFVDDRGFWHKHDDSTTFVQGDFNKAFANEVRTFEPIEDYLLDSAGFQMMLERFQMHTGIRNRVGVHQVRITIDEQGVPAAPEGPHTDGFDYIAAFIVKRVNMTGGEFCIWDVPDQDMPTDVFEWPEPIFKDNLWTPKSRHYAILNDRDFRHTGYDLSRIDPDSESYWDWFVLTGNKGD